MDLSHYYDQHWSHIAEGQVDYSRLQLIIDRVEPGEYVLDTGCGPGFLAEKLVQKGAKVVCTDVSEVGAQRTQGRGITAQKVDLDVEKLPFSDSEFETVICNSNLEHLFYLERNLSECIRVLKQGGKFIWMEPNLGHWRYRLELLRGHFPYLKEAPTDPYHIRYLTAYEMKRLCLENGLEIKEMLGHAGLFCRALYPKFFYKKPFDRYIRQIYQRLVYWRPSLFARYLLFRCEKPISKI